MVAVWEFDWKSVVLCKRDEVLRLLLRGPVSFWQVQEITPAATSVIFELNKQLPSTRRIVYHNARCEYELVRT
jgi:hypothetical protein